MGMAVLCRMFGAAMWRFVCCNRGVQGQGNTCGKGDTCGNDLLQIHMGVVSTALDRADQQRVDGDKDDCNDYYYYCCDDYYYYCTETTTATTTPTPTPTPTTTMSKFMQEIEKTFGKFDKNKDGRVAK